MKVIIYKCHDRHTDDYIKIYEYSPENLEAVKQKVINDWESPTYKSQEVHYDGWDFEYGWDFENYSAYKIEDTLKTVE